MADDTSTSTGGTPPGTSVNWRAVGDKCDGFAGTAADKFYCVDKN